MMGTNPLAFDAANYWGVGLRLMDDLPSSAGTPQPRKITLTKTRYKSSQTGLAYKVTGYQTPRVLCVFLFFIFAARLIIVRRQT